MVLTQHEPKGGLLSYSNDADLNWWFGCGDSLLGEKGNLSSTISALERGGANIGTFEEPWSDLKLSKWHVDIDRERKIRARLLTLTRETQRILIAFYSKEQNRIPQLEAKYELMSGIMLYLAKTKRREVAPEPSELSALPDSGDDSHERSELRRRLGLAESMLNRLPPARRDVFVLFEVEQMSGLEVASALGIPLGTARSRLRLARSFLSREVRRSCANE